MEIVKMIKKNKEMPRYKIYFNNVLRYVYEGDSILEDGTIETAFERMARHLKQVKAYTIQISY